jgi:S1-C subfamily serine protease
MKRTLTTFISALLGGGVVLAVLAATGSLNGDTTKTITEIQAAAPTPSNASVTTPGLTPHDIYERAAPGVAFVTSTVVQQSTSPFLLESQQEQGTDTGSGIVINANGTILTNYHVIANEVKVTVSFEHGKTVEAKVIGKDLSNDLAVLKIPTEGLTLHALKLGNSSSAQVGDPAYAIGNPFDLERTLTTGVISALQRKIEAPNGFTISNVLQTDAPINPGNSGGPLLNGAAEVIGINSQIETGGSGSDGSVGIGFAVPINTAKEELPQLLKGGTVSGAYLGLTSLTIDGSLSGLNLPVKEGALVQSVQKGTPAEKSGIRGGDISANVNGEPIELGGDIILGVNGKKIKNSEELASIIGVKKPGQSVTIELLRANPNGGGYTEHKTVKATLTQRPASAPKREENQEG